MTTSLIQGFINSIPDKRIARAFTEIFDRIAPSKLDTAITAHAGGTKAAALSLKSTCSFHDVTTVATAADSILLPPAKEGEFHFVKNSGAASMQVFGQGTDTIDSVATGTGVAQLAGDGVLYYCLVPGNWVRLGGVSATEVFSAITTATLNATTSITVTSANAASLAVGRLGATTPAFQVDSSTGSQVAGLKVTGASTGGTVAVVATDSGADAGLSIASKGTGALVLNKPVASHTTKAAINSTATATAAQVATGYITSTSAAGTTITLPTGTDLGTALGASQGYVHELYVDNTAGANPVTIAVAVDGVLSGAATTTAASFGQLTVAAGVTGIGRFTLMFTSATHYIFTRTA